MRTARKSSLLAELSETAKHLGPGSLEALLLARGNHFTRRKEWYRGCGWRRGPAKQCYRNSYRIVQEDPERFTYCEGFALSEFGAVEHAWVEDHDGVVIDPTWTACTEYLGFRLEYEFLCEAITTQGRYGVLSNIEYRPLAAAASAKVRSKNATNAKAK